MRRGNTWARWIWLAIVVYMMYTVGRLAYRNYQLNVQELQLKNDVTQLENDIQTLNYQIVYYQSDSYKEKMLLEKLNLQKSGEKVVAINQQSPELLQAAPAKKTKISNPTAWWDFLVGI